MARDPSERPADAPLLAVESVTKRYPSRSSAEGEIVAVDSVSFSVNAGESCGLAGESGSGKSTLARMVVGLEAPTEGAIRREGAAPSSSSSWRVRKANARVVQMVFQDPYLSLNPRQTVAQALDEVQRVHFPRSAAERRQRTEQLLDWVGLSRKLSDSSPRSLSGGQRQRVAIARALAAEPRLIVFDEAVAALDVSVQAQVLNLLTDLREELELTYLFISHDLAVMNQVCDTLVILRHGELVESGIAEDVLRSPQTEYTRLLIDSIPRPGMFPTA